MSPCVIMLLIEGRLLESLNLRKLLSFNKDIFLLFIKSTRIAWHYDCYILFSVAASLLAFLFFLWVRLSLCRSKREINILFCIYCIMNGIEIVFISFLGISAYILCCLLIALFIYSFFKHLFICGGAHMPWHPCEVWTICGIWFILPA